MLRLLIKNLLVIFFLSASLGVVAFYGGYRLYPQFGVYFDESIDGLLQWVLILNTSLLFFSLPTLLIALKSIRKRKILAIVLYYYAPILLIIFDVYTGIEGCFDIESSVPNLGVPVLFMLISTIFYLKTVKKMLIIT